MGGEEGKGLKKKTTFPTRVSLCYNSSNIGKYKESQDASFQKFYMEIHLLVGPGNVDDSFIKLLLIKVNQPDEEIRIKKLNLKKLC